MSDVDSNSSGPLATKRSALLLGVAVAVGLAAYFYLGKGPLSSVPTNPILRQAAEGSASLSIEFGDQRDRSFANLDWHEGDTVQQLLEKARQADATFEFKQFGTGESAFVSEIDGQANEGGGETARNWIFYVNGERATVSVATQPIASGDHVAWKLERYEAPSPNQ